MELAQTRLGKADARIGGRPRSASMLSPAVVGECCRRGRGMLRRKEEAILSEGEKTLPIIQIHSALRLCAFSSSPTL